MALHDRKVLVWCSISANRIFRPYIFEESVNKDNYLQMLQIFFWPKQLHTAAYQKCYFQQDDVTPHTANIVQEYFRAKFSTKFIDKKMWPPRSPDLNPCDFYLWGYLKSVVYYPLSKTLEDLKANIKRKIKKISKNISNSVFLDFEKSCNLIITAEGGHIENK